MEEIGRVAKEVRGRGWVSPGRLALFCLPPRGYGKPLARCQFPSYICSFLCTVNPVLDACSLYCPAIPPAQLLCLRPLFFVSQRFNLHSFKIGADFHDTAINKLL